MQRAVETALTIFVGAAQTIFVALCVFYLLAANILPMLATAAMAAVCGHFVSQRSPVFVAIMQVWHGREEDEYNAWDLDDDLQLECECETCAPQLRLCNLESEN